MNEKNDIYRLIGDSVKCHQRKGHICSQKTSSSTMNYTQKMRLQIKSIYIHT